MVPINPWKILLFTTSSKIVSEVVARVFNVKLIPHIILVSNLFIKFWKSCSSDACNLGGLNSVFSSFFNG